MDNKPERIRFLSLDLF